MADSSTFWLLPAGKTAPLPIEQRGQQLYERAAVGSETLVYFGDLTP